MGNNARCLAERTQRGRKGRRGVWREREQGTAIVGAGQGFRALELELKVFSFCERRYPKLILLTLRSSFCNLSVLFPKPVLYLHIHLKLEFPSFFLNK